VLESAVTVISQTGTSVTLAAAVTYDQTLYQGILTLPDYTTAPTAERVKYVWSADAAGVMSNADEGKKTI